MNQLLNRLFLVDDCPQLIIQIVDDEIINYEEAVRLICAEARKSSTETKLDLLAQLLAQICVRIRKQALQYVEDYTNSVINEASHSPQKTFMNKCLREIGESFSLPLHKEIIYQCCSSSSFQWKNRHQ